MELLARVRCLLKVKAYNDLMSDYQNKLVGAKIAAVEAFEYADNIINTVREPLIALDQDLRVITASRSFYDFFKAKPEETIGQLIYELGNKQWDICKLRELLETILPEKATFDNYEVEHDFTTIGKRIMLLNARQVKRVMGKDLIILLAIEDITERKRIEEALKEEHRQLQQAFDEIKTLRGILPICAYCKKIRDDEGYWDHVEKYVSAHTDAKFTHGICPSCFEREMDALKS